MVDKISTSILQGKKISFFAKKEFKLVWKVVDYSWKDSIKEFYNATDASSKEKSQISSKNANEIFQWVLILFFLHVDSLKRKAQKHDFNT